mgnify:CR=1 FL=1
MELREQLKEEIAIVEGFPKTGISFKDITPLLLKPALVRQIINDITAFASEQKADFIAGIDARGFLFGIAAAEKAQLPFLPIRKAGKLPRKTITAHYDLEYGSNALSIHEEDLKAGARVLIHDDLLATGGTASAAAELVEKAGAEVCGFHFLIELTELSGRSKLPESNIRALCAFEH